METPSIVPRTPSLSPSSTSELKVRPSGGGWGSGFGLAGGLAHPETPNGMMEFGSRPAGRYYL